MTVCQLRIATFLGLSLAGCMCSEAHTRSDAGFDAGRDAGPADAGSDAGRWDAGDADLDAGHDAGFDADFPCPPDPRYWNTDGGFLLAGGRTTPYCVSDSQCHVADYDDNQSCYSGVCCNGRFDTVTCTCSCGRNPQCGGSEFCCMPVGETELRCAGSEPECGRP